MQVILAHKVTEENESNKQYWKGLVGIRGSLILTYSLDRGSLSGVHTSIKKLI